MRTTARQALVVVLAAFAAILAPAISPNDTPIPTARAHDSATIHGSTCTGYDQVAAYVTPAGNLYESLRNTCVATYTISGNYSNEEAVTRSQCFRNAVPYNGCRWAGKIELQSLTNNEPGWTTRAETSFCVTCGGAYIYDSGRSWSAHWARYTPALIVVRAKSESIDVRFLLADGSTVLVGESDRWSGTWP